MIGSSHWRTACLAGLLLAFGPAAQAASADTASESAMTWETTATVDTLHAARPAQTTALSQLDVRLGIDAARLFGWQGTTLRIEALADHGGKPNGKLGSLQGISNIEVRQSAARLYSTWVEHELARDVHALVGLYDLNSEFYATDASSLLIHPAFGIGSELGQTGRNGPSIFPALSFGLRLKARAASGLYAQAAVLDAVPGDPDHAGRTTVRLSRGEGALLAAETGWQEGPADDPGPRRWGVGLWGYTRSVERIDRAGTARNAGGERARQRDRRGLRCRAARRPTLGRLRSGGRHGRRRRRPARARPSKRASVRGQPAARP